MYNLVLHDGQTLHPQQAATAQILILGTPELYEMLLPPLIN